MKIDLTDAQVRTILKALAVCEGDMTDAKEESKSEGTREYYTRKAEEYGSVWDAVYTQTTDDEHLRKWHRTLSGAEGHLDRIPTV